MAASSSSSRAITPVSSLFFRLLHHEPVDMRVDPLADIASDKVRDPYDSNQAIPTLLFGRYRQAFAVHFPALKVKEKRWMSLLAYPLSGGSGHGASCRLAWPGTCCGWSR